MFSAHIPVHLLYPVLELKNKIIFNLWVFIFPDKLILFYFHLLLSLCLRVVCKCGYCGPQKQALSEWERHTGSKSKNWKTSVRVKGSMLPLEQWVCT